MNGGDAGEVVGAGDGPDVRGASGVHPAAAVAKMAIANTINRFDPTPHLLPSTARWNFRRRPSRPT